jgi:hypothetical protein
MPLYRAGPDGWAVQMFCGSDRRGGPRLTADEQRLKQAMLGAFTSQREVLTRFSAAQERYRVAPDHQFCRTAEQRRTPIREAILGDDRLPLARTRRPALAELGLERRA